MDDIVLARRDETKMSHVKEELLSRFHIKDLGKLRYFLGQLIIPNQEERGTWIGQPAYTKRLLTEMRMNDCKPAETPVDPGNHLVKATEDEKPLDQQC